MKKKIKILVSFILCLICTLICSNVTTAFASTYSSDYTDVLNDLRKDENFDIKNYPSLSVDEVKNSDTQATLEIIQIAESSSKELYLYVYQPLNKDLFFTATSISMSCEFSENGENLHPNNYEIELVSSYDVLCKYVVKDFVVSDEVDRYYNIVCIRRNFDYTYDEKISGTEDDGNEKAIGVGQQWHCYYLNNKLYYEMGKFDTLEIVVKFTGCFNFSSGIKWGNLIGKYEIGQSWFICFDLEYYVAKHIYDADMSYKIRDMKSYNDTGNSSNNYINEGQWSEEKRITLTDEDIASYDGGGLLAKEYKWNRIMTSEAFIKNAEEQDITISDEVKSKILESQWTFSFLETEVNNKVQSYTRYQLGATFVYQKITTEYYDIDKVSILRIHFLNFDDKPYDLAVVSDRVNPDNISDGYGGIDTDFFEEWFQKLGMLIGIIVLIIILIFCWPIVSTILSMLLKGVWIIISLPFKILGKIFNTKRKKP